jgi:ATP-dependent helicase/nuclease subunit A
VIHRLLELAARSPSRAVEDNAGDILSVYGLDPARADEAVGVVRSVMASDIWQRAQQSQQCFTEPPFHIFAAEIGQDAPLPTVLRGAIDLVFREGDEWVLVDYKTTDPEREGLHDLVEKYAPQVRLYVRAWERATSGRVKEAGLFFTRTGEFVLIPIA